MPCVIRTFNPNRNVTKEEGMSDCIFCRNLPKVLENGLAYALNDINPLSKGHMLFIPKRHHVTVLESTPQEIEALFDLMNKAKGLLDNQYQPDGYNVQANCGAVAGQIVMHAHLHLIPRYK